jgi:hypothetical protein
MPGVKAFNTAVALPADAASALHATTKQQMDAAVATKANTSHTHPESDVTSLTTDLAAKASTTHAASHAAGGSDVLTPLAIGAEKRLIPTATKTAAYTAVSGDLVMVDATSGAVTITAPATAAGAEFAVKKLDSSVNIVTVQRAGSDTIGATSATSVQLKLQDQAIAFAANSANWVQSENNLGLANLDARFQASGSYAPLASPTFTGLVTAVRVIQTPQTVSYAATVTLDASTGNAFKITATGALTLGVPTNPTDGQMLFVEVLASGAQRVVTLNASIVLTGGIPSTLTITSAQVGVIGLRYSVLRGNVWLCLAAQSG